MNQTNPRYRPKGVLAQDIVMVLGLPLSYGTKYAVLDDALWKWSEFHGKYDGCFCWSAEALKVAEQTKELRHEHLIPRGVLIAMLISNPPASAEALLSWLNSRCVGVVVTKAEDAKLNKAGLRSKMPADWDGKDIWARYRAAGIRLAAGLGGEGRAESVALARGLLGDRRLMAFLRWTRNEGGPWPVS